MVDRRLRAEGPLLGGRRPGRSRRRSSCTNMAIQAPSEPGRERLLSVWSSEAIVTHDAGRTTTSADIGRYNMEVWFGDSTSSVLHGRRPTTNHETSRRRARSTSLARTPSSSRSTIAVSHSLSSLMSHRMPVAKIHQTMLRKANL